MLPANGAGVAHRVSGADAPGNRPAWRQGQFPSYNQNQAPTSRPLRTDRLGHLHGARHHQPVEHSGSGNVPTADQSRMRSSSAAWAYRANTLAVIVAKIGQGAQLEINAKGTGFIDHRAVRAGPPMRQNGGRRHERPPPAFADRLRPRSSDRRRGQIMTSALFHSKFVGAAVAIKHINLLNAFIERAEARAYLWSIGELTREAVDVLQADADRLRLVA